MKEAIKEFGNCKLTLSGDKNTISKRLIENPLMKLPLQYQFIDFDEIEFQSC